MNNHERITHIQKSILEDAMKQRWFPLKNVDPDSFILKYVYPAEGNEMDTVLAVMECDHRKINLLLHFDHNKFIDAVESGDALGFIENILSEKYEAMKFTGNLQLLEDHMSNFRPLNVNQSNSSFVLDNTVIGKFMRTYSTVDNPDFVIPWKLWNETDFREIPEPIGQIEFMKNQCLFTFARLMPGSTDYWSYLYDILKEEKEGTLVMNEAMRLSKITARLHHALADLKGKEFEPESFTISDARLLKSSLMELGEKLINICRQIAESNPYAQIILKNSSVLEDKINSVMNILNTTLRKQRIHGDYHLGQILKTEDAPKIIDFEGEPMRSSAYRRSKQMPMKDLAGLIRSFDYLCSAKLGSENKLAAESREIIIRTYIETRSDQDISFSGNVDQFRTILDVFIMEKAIYEAIYESENRPDWINIPLSYIAKFLPG